MKRCQRCDLNFPNSLSFCESCGGSLAETVSLHCPACGATVQPGWKFCIQCRAQLPSSAIANLYGTSGSQTPAPTAPLNAHEENVVPPQPGYQTVPSSPPADVSKTQIRVRCRSCKNLVDEDTKTCGFCGASMFDDDTPLRTPVAQVPPPVTTPPARTTTSQNAGPQDWYAEPDPYHETYRPTPQPPPEEIPGQHYSVPPQKDERTPPRASMFESYGAATPTPRASFRWWHVVLAVFVLLTVGSLAGVAIYTWLLRPNAVTNTQPNQGPATPVSSTSSSTTTNGQNSANPSADKELTQLIERRASAKDSDKSEIVALFENAERKYPADYRFPYEHARLIGKEFISHDQAFRALYLAAQKAIDTGKAQEMEDRLLVDKDGDLHKLSRGHPEWKVIDKALSTNDKSGLKADH